MSGHKRWEDLKKERPIEEKLDIVEELQLFSELITECGEKARVVMLDPYIFDQAASKIQELRQLGDQLVNCLSWAMEGKEMPEDMVEVMDAWISG